MTVDVAGVAVLRDAPKGSTRGEREGEKAARAEAGELPPVSVLFLCTSCVSVES